LKISAAQQPRERCRAGKTHLHAGLTVSSRSENRQSQHRRGQWTRKL